LPQLFSSYVTFSKSQYLVLFSESEDGCRSGKPAAQRDDFLVELLALVQKYWPQAEGPPGQL
jgi:hypothetical protein